MIPLANPIHKWMSLKSLRVFCQALLGVFGFIKAIFYKYKTNPQLFRLILNTCGLAR